MHQFTRVLAVVTFGLALALPGTLFILGHRNVPIENRAPVLTPEFAVDRLLDTELYESVSAYYRDGVPFRSLGIRVDAGIDAYLFGDSPSNSVFFGDDGWMFLTASVDLPCKNDTPVDAMARRVKRIDRIMEITGRGFVFTVVPDKQAIYSEFTGPFEEQTACSRNRRAELRNALNAADLRNYVDLWSEMELLKQESDLDVYFQRDSHWTWEGALKLTERIVDKLDTNLWDPTAVTAIPNTPKVGDLSLLIGLPSTDYSTFYEIDRGVVEQVDSAPEDGPNRYRVTDASSFGGQTLVVHDSFGERIENLLNRYLMDSTWLHWRIAGDEVLADRIDTTDSLVIQTVERFAYGRLGNLWSNTPAALAGGLLDELPHSTIPFDDLSGRDYEVESGSIQLDEPGARLRMPFALETEHQDVYLLLDAETSSGKTVRVTARQVDGTFDEGLVVRQQVDHDDRSLIGFDLSEGGNLAQLEIRATELTIYRIIVVTIEH